MHYIHKRNFALLDGCEVCRISMGKSNTYYFVIGNISCSSNVPDLFSWRAVYPISVCYEAVMYSPAL